MNQHSKFSQRRRNAIARRNRWTGSSPARGRSYRAAARGFEALEKRWMLAAGILPAADLLASAADGGTSSPIDANFPTVVAQSGAAGTASDIAAEGESDPQPDLVAFAQALAATDGVAFFGAAWCAACTQQKELYEDGAEFLPFVEVTNPDRSRNETGVVENITSYPTWEFPDGSRETGVLSLDTISERAGVAIPTDNAPFVAPIEDQVVLDGSPLHVGLDGYDPNGGPLTYTITTSDPSLVVPTVLSGNRSATIRFADWGEVTLELFEQRAPEATGRFVELAEASFYDAAANDPNITVHRVIDNFMLQFGDPTGSGAGGSDLPDFDDDFHPELQHNAPGMISWAKSNDDTNNSQVFITDTATRHLDFNHSVFGMLTEGEQVRDEITRTATDENNRPVVPVNIESVSIFEDTENAVAMLEAVEGSAGSATITVTATDADDNEYVEQFDVTVEPDTANGGPYLEEIAPVQTTAGTPASFQLSANDVEGDAVLYGGVQAGDVDYTLAVDSETGEVSVDPPAGFVGTMEVLVYVRPETSSDTSDPFDTQTVDITVAPAAPQEVVLATASDSGASDSDAVTNLTNLDFAISGVTDGATVRLHRGDTIIGQTTASGESVTITATDMSEGTQAVYATQVIEGLTSPESPSTVVTIDTTAPADFTSTPPTSALAGSELVYDAGSPEEGSGELTYDLLNGPDGATIDPVDGVVTWTPAAADVGTQSFSVVATDTAGNSTTQELNIEVDEGALVELRLEATDAEGNPLSMVQVGDEFELRVFVQDIGADTRGVFSAYLDLLYDEQLVVVDGPLAYGDAYPNSRTGDTGTAGIVDEVGAVASSQELGSDEFLLVSVPMQATLAGEASFESEPADVLPAHEVLRFAGDFIVAEDEILFGGTSLTVEPAFGANDDIFNVDEDSGSTSLNVLANDEAFAGSSGDLSVVSVGSTSDGGVVEVGPNGNSVVYTPAEDFFGEEVFTYTVSDGAGTDTAEVTVQVMPINDPPSAVDDAITVMEDQQNVALDVLANDSSAPDDAAEELSIVSFEGLSAGGSLSITAEGDRLLYTPAADFFGTETFTYTVDDGNGGTDSAAVTVTVAEENDPPSAADDQLVVSEDSSANSLDVLANDDTAGDPDESLTIVEVSEPSSGGTVTIGDNEQILIYTPAPDFFGAEEFTYRITDGNGGFAEATVSVGVTAVNDPPTAAGDELTVVKDSADNELSVLENDSFEPDSEEELTVASVEGLSGNGTATVSEDGTSILYTPEPGFTGEETLTYTIEDPEGATAQATVTLTVLEYVPSSIGGTMYLDVNQDGDYNASETPLGGVTVLLQGTDMFGETVELEQITAADGSYEFRELAPGSYEVVQVQPAYLIDGIDRAGDELFREPGNTLPVELEQDTHRADFHFGERGREAEHISLTDFFASRPREAVLVATSRDGTGNWYAIEGGWEHAKSLTVGLHEDFSGADLEVSTDEPAEYSTTLNLQARDQVELLRGTGANRLMRVVATPQSLFPDGECGCEGVAEEAEEAAEQAEGEANVVGSDAGAEGETVAADAAQQVAAAASVATAAVGGVQFDPLASVSSLPSPPVEGIGSAGSDSDKLSDPPTRTPLSPPTPADAHLATDLLLTESGGEPSSFWERDDERDAGDEEDFATAVDEVIGQLAESESVSELL